MRISEVETPALIIDLDALEHNIGVIADCYRDKSIRLRPHVKNHKSPRILGMQMAAGGTVGGICAAKVSEAEAFAEIAGNVLIANQVVGEDKIARLAALARRLDTTVAVDAGVQVEQLSRGAQQADVVLGVVIEVDTSMGRGGVRTTQQAVALARQVLAAPNLRFQGVMSHQVPRARPPSREQRFAEGNRWIARVIEVKQAIEDAGIPVALVSTGESWTYDVAAMHPEVDEIQGGNLHRHGSALRVHDRVSIRCPGHGTGGSSDRRRHSRGRRDHRRNRCTQRRPNCRQPAGHRSRLHRPPRRRSARGCRRHAVDREPLLPTDPTSRTSR